MPTFQYNALDPGGAGVAGEIQAASRAEAYRMLRAKGLQPSSLGEEGTATAAKVRKSSSDEGNVRLSTSDILTFTEEIAELLDAGLQLESALHVIEQRPDQSPVRSVATRLRRLVREGQSFSTALRGCGSSFSALYCSLAAAGEASGALPQILKRQCAYMTLIEDLRRRVTSSLLYPSIVFVSAIVLMFVFLTFLVPQLTVLLGKTGQKLPLVTQLLIVVSTFFGKWWWAVAASVGATILLVRAAVRTPAGREWWHRTMLNLPVVGPVLRARFYAETLQTLSTVVSNGVPLLQGLHLLLPATSNVWLRGLLQRVSEMVGEGIGLSTAFRRTGFFPTALLDILGVGEKTGDIAIALERAAKRYDRELTSKITILTTLIQPAIILMVALFVGLVAYSMIAGILTSVSSLKAR
jgi:type II secretory pathway component PulF